MCIICILKQLINKMGLVRVFLNHAVLNASKIAFLKEIRPISSFF